MNDYFTAWQELYAWLIEEQNKNLRIDVQDVMDEMSYLAERWVGE